MNFRRVQIPQVLAVAAAVLLIQGCGSSTTPTPTTYSRVDRMAIPGASLFFVPAVQKDAFSAGDPTTDVANWGPAVTDSITALRRAMADSLGPEDNPGIAPADLTNKLVPDMLVVDLSQPLHFPNGRAPEDDAMSLLLGLVLNRGNVLGGGAGIPLGVPANDKLLLTQFPYLAEPAMAGP